MASRSFFSPRSTVNAITSQPWSLSQRMATDVSSPPEYASTKRLLNSVGPPPECGGRAKPVRRPPCIGQEMLERPGGARVAEHGDDGVVTGDGARDAGK